MVIYDDKWFARRIKERKPKTHSEYKILGTYQDAHTPIKIYHKVCGTTFSTTPNVFLRGENGCPICGSSCLLYTSPSPRDRQKSRMPSSA